MAGEWQLVSTSLQTCGFGERLSLRDAEAGVKGWGIDHDKSYMGIKLMPWTEDDDNRVREFCKTVDVGKLTACPKCGVGDGPASEMVMARFCQHKYCPFRAWEVAKRAACRAADPYPSKP